MRWSAAVALLGALAFSTGAQATQRAIPQPLLGTWTGWADGEAAKAPQTMTFVGGAYELRLAADAKNYLTLTSTCTFKKGLLVMKLTPLPNDTGWEQVEAQYDGNASCAVVYRTLQWGPAAVAPKLIIGPYTWVSASTSSSSQGVAAAKPVHYKAALDVAQEVPKPKGTHAGAHALFSATLSGTKLKWTLTFSGLTGAATAAHIHKGVRGKSGAVLVPLCGPCRSPAKGTVTLTAAQIKLLKKGGTYVNIHTAKNPNGEVRGQVTIGTSSSGSATPKATTSKTTHDPWQGLWQPTGQGGDAVTGQKIQIKLVGALYEVRAANGWTGKFGCTVKTGELLWKWKVTASDTVERFERYASTNHCPHALIHAGSQTFTLAGGKLSTTFVNFSLCCDTYRLLVAG